MGINRNALNKMMIESIQEDKKQYNLKSKGCILYKKEGDYFVTIIIGITGMRSDEIRVAGYLKPYIIDDIFWDVFHMSDNSKAPMGLRANGAFKVDPLVVFSNTIAYEEAEKIGTIAKDLLHQCHQEIIHVIEEINDMNGFLLFAKDKGETGFFDYDLTCMLLLIHNKKYQEAGKIAEEQLSNGNHGRFKNEGKYIYEHIVDYCNIQLEM